MSVYYKVDVGTVKSGIIRDVGFGAWAVVSALASYMDGQGFCYPSQKRLASDLGVTRRTIITYLNELDERGYITKHKRGTQTVIYQLKLDKLGIEKFGSEVQKIS